MADPAGYGPDDFLTVAAAATVAKRSIRTIRRAYRRGALAAHRDGNGRSVRICYRDLRRWMMAEPAAKPETGAAPPRGRRRRRRSENVRLLESARDESAASSSHPAP
jgi:excisionase family DNA binding protein